MAREGVALVALGSLGLYLLPSLWYNGIYFEKHEKEFGSSEEQKDY